MKRYTKGVSELFGAVLLILITASLGIAVLYFFITTTDQLKTTLTKLGDKCSFRIVDVAINKTDSLVSSMIIQVYGLSNKICELKYIYVLNVKNLNITYAETCDLILHKGELKSVLLNLTSKNKKLRLPFILRIYSVDGSYDDYYVG